MNELARRMGFKGASSVQRYLDRERFAAKAYPTRLIARFADALEGQGSPPVQRREVLALGEPATLTDRLLASAEGSELVALAGDVLASGDAVLAREVADFMRFKLDRLPKG